MTHTPGPWEIQFGHQIKDGPRYWQIADASDAICCNQFCYAQNSEANAHLIAAAPELLAALKMMLDEEADFLVAIDAGLAAISKAEG